MSSELADQLRRHLADTRLFPDPGTALLAVSGGPDSVALAFLMLEVANQWGLDLVIGHVDHGIAAESADVSRHVEHLAERIGMPFHLRRLELGPRASETRARRARYRALRDMQQGTGARYVVTAHHADDQAETVFFRFIRGTGLSGLSGIPARGPNGLVRPLLPFSRDSLAAWVESRVGSDDFGVVVHHDPANADERHDRAWIRTRALPMLVGRYGERVRQAIRDVGNHAAHDRAAWRALLRELEALQFRRGEAAVEVARDPLATYDKALSEAILRAVAGEAGCRLSPRRAARLLVFVLRGTSGRVLQLGKGWEAELAFDRVRISRGRGDDEAPTEVLFGDEEIGRVRWRRWSVSWHREAAGRAARESFTTWITPGTVSLRAPAASDRLRPLGGTGRRKVRRLLMEARVPVRERDRYPLVVRGDDVLWVPGICRSGTEVPDPGEPALWIEARVDEGE